jgi:multidrug efflux pump subunit AcrA (membrane-fusion protein)
MKRRTKVTISASAIVVIALAVFFMFGPRKASNGNVGGSGVAVAKKGTIRVRVLSTGTIQPFTRVEVYPPEKGRIEEVLVDEGDWVKKGTILALVSGEERTSLLDAANSMMKEAAASGDSEQVKQAESAREMALKAYLPIPITSPLNARVIKRSCQPGQNVGAAELLFVLADRLVAGVEVDETDIGKIHVGQDALISLDAFPDDKYTGKVVKISQEGRIVSNVVIYDVQVDADNVPPNWSSGMTANVEFVLLDLKDVLVLPAGAVRQEGMKKIVMLAGDRPRPQEIETGATDGKMIEVKSGITEGDSVVVSGYTNTQENPGTNDRSRTIGRAFRFSRGR